MASILTIWGQHPEWGETPQQHREAMDEAARDYVLQLKSLDRPAAARIARADLQEMKRHAQARIDFANVDLYDEETATPFEKWQHDLKMQHDMMVKGVQALVKPLLPLMPTEQAAEPESKGEREGRAMREFCGLIIRYLDVMEIDWRHCSRAEPQRQGQPLQHQSEALPLPDSLNTETARKVFGRAIARGWMSREASGYKWQGTDGKGGRGSKAQLAYFCGKVCGYRYTASMGNVGGRVPYEDLQALFDVTRLDQALPQVHTAKNPQRWRQVIDSLFDEEQAPC